MDTVYINTYEFKEIFGIPKSSQAKLLSKWQITFSMAGELS